MSLSRILSSPAKSQRFLLGRSRGISPRQYLQARLLAAGILLVAFFVPPASAQFPPAPGTGPGLAETIEAIDSARVTTRILYITAHPDDESAAVLTYLARGLHADVALLSLTRGEGGQNALGPEQAPQLGLIRTQELLAATRGYGVELFYTRAKDFGYSKTPEETEKVWGEQVLVDMVRVIRTFRPNIIINHWGGVHSGHGHHQAAGILTPKAAELAADRSFHTADLSDVSDPWRVQRILDVYRGDPPQGLVLPLDEISTLWGKSYRQIGLDAFVHHRTQGIASFLNSSFLQRPISLTPEDGKPLGSAELQGPLSELAKNFPTVRAALEEPVKKIDDALMKARESALRLDWPAAVRELESASNNRENLFGKFLRKCGMSDDDECLSVKVGDKFPELVSELQAEGEYIQKALQLALGLQIETRADRSEIVTGETFSVRVRASYRPGVPFVIGPTALNPIPYWKIERKEITPGREWEFRVTPPQHLIDPYAPGDVVLPVPTPLFRAKVYSSNVMDRDINFSAPVVALRATSTTVERLPLRIVPAYTLAVDPKQQIENLSKTHTPFDVLLRVHSYSAQPGKVTVGLDLPPGWTSSEPVSLAFSGTEDQYARLTVTPTTRLAAGNQTISAYAKRGEEKFTTSLEPLPSIPTQLWSEPAECKIHAFKINVPENLHVGYVTAESEPVPETIERLGIKVDMLDAAALAFSDLSRFDAIVVGVRAYELRNDLPGANQRLLDYVRNGGTLIVQYNRDFVWDKLQPAPYPAKIGNPTPRITDENSPVTFLKPDDSLMNRPNKITQDDFNNWVQERGLYFWSDFDSKYTPLLAMNDPGEKDLNGALVYAHYGKGTYIYTGLAFFRQLPEGIPGAYRLFVNLLSVSRAK